MLDRILIVSRYKAFMIYDDGRLIELSSDIDVRDIIKIILSPIVEQGISLSNAESLEDTQVIAS